MRAPAPLASLRQLRWLLAAGSGAVHWLRLAADAVTVLQALVAHAPCVVPTNGELSGPVTLVPTPRVIQHLAAPANLPHIAQLLLTHDPLLMRAACSLLLSVCRSSTASLHRLYTTGVFFFALAYVGKDLEPMGDLLLETHDRQHFQGARDPATVAALPVGERSVLGTLLPESLLYQLEAYGARAFAAQMIRHIVPLFHFGDSRDMMHHLSKSA
jgi:DnaJ homolog subfamily C member 13